MGYQSIIERDRPTIFKTFDDASNKTHPLVAGLGTAALVTTAPFTHTFDEWNQVPFTAEIWFKPLSKNVVTVLGHDDDGITYDPNTKMITWTIKQIDGSFISTSQVGSDKVMYLVAQYTGYSVVLYVNGSSSSTFTSLPIMSTGVLRTGAGRMSVDALALYDYLLSDNQMLSHYFEGIDFPNVNSVVANAENYFDLTDQSEKIALRLDFRGWTQVYLDGTIVNSDGSIVNDLEVTDGKLFASVMLPDDEILQGAKITYDFTGSAPVVEISSDSLTWTPVENNTLLPVVPVNNIMGDVDPIIRVTLENDTVFTQLMVVVYSDVVSMGQKESNYLKLTRPATSGYETMYPYEQDDLAGANINGGGIALVKNTDDVVAGISFWYKGTRPGNGTINGGTGHVDDQWNFYYHNVTTFNFTDYQGRIANFATWPEVQNASKLYSSYFTKPTLRVIDVDKITVAEAQDGIRVSQKNWIMI